MEPGRALARLSARGRRAVALITVSLFAIAVASVAYVGPGLHLGQSAKSKTTSPNLSANTNSSPRPNYPIWYDFATPSVGWAATASAGETSVFKTVDGGKHWRLSSRLMGNVVASLQFVDKTHGFIGTSVGHRLYRTSDGGAHWVEAKIPDDRAYRITFSDARHGAAFVYPTTPSSLLVVYTTADGGDTWHQLPDLPRDASSPPVFRGEEAWLGGSAPQPGGPHLYRSMDGGLTWTSIEIPRPSQPLSDGATAFVTPNLLPGTGAAVVVSVGYACLKASAKCNRGLAVDSLFVSVDRGVTWTEASRPPVGLTGTDMAYQDSVHWWAVGSGSLFKTSDAGQTWKEVSSTLPQGQIVLHVFDAQHAWALVFSYMSGGSGLIATGDGGHTWWNIPALQPS
jgi:photosystem II stability/assembly factor-like uncharacterized protein